MSMALNPRQGKRLTERQKLEECARASSPGRYLHGSYNPEVHDAKIRKFLAGNWKAAVIENLLDLPPGTVKRYKERNGC